jgi:hypothetical protein
LERFVGRNPDEYSDGIALYCAYFVPNALDFTGLSDVILTYDTNPSVTLATGLSFKIVWLLQGKYKELTFFQEANITKVGKDKDKNVLGTRSQKTYDISKVRTVNIEKDDYGYMEDTHKGDSLQADIANFQLSGKEVCTIEETHVRNWSFVGGVTLTGKDKKETPWAPNLGEGQVSSEVNISAPGIETLSDIVGSLKDVTGFTPVNIALSGTINVSALYEILKKTASWTIAGKGTKGDVDSTRIADTQNNKPLQ